MTAWIILEINILSFLPIICITKINQETEAATKYFLIQAIRSLLLLTGSVILYQQKLSTIIIFTLLTALLFKLGAFPCHFWYPSVISSISWINCLILSTWQKIAPLFLLSIIISTTSSKILLTVAGFNAVGGGLIGINQTHLRTLLAYSSIRHLGWILSMVAIRKTPIWMFYFSIYCLIITPLFLTFILLNYKTIFDLYNTFKIHYLTPLIITLLILSLAGMPPLTGFSPKLIVITTIINHSYYFTLIILLWGSYLTLYYYLRVAFRCIMVQTTKLPTYSPSVHLLIPITFFIATSIIGLIMIIIYALITID